MATVLDPQEGFQGSGSKVYWGIDTVTKALSPTLAETGRLSIGAPDAMVGRLWLTNLFPTGQALLTSTKAATWKQFCNEELFTLDTVGTTTDSVANMLPANSIIMGVCARVTVGITTAINWTVGDDAEGARFIAAQSVAGLLINYTFVGLSHWFGASTTTALGPTQAAAAKLRVTTNAGVGAGKIRLAVFGYTFAAPTS